MQSSQDLRGKAVGFIAGEALSYFKYSQQIAAVIFWALSLALLAGFTLIQAQDQLNLSVGGLFPGPGKFSWGSREILGLYAALSFGFYLVMAVVRYFRPARKPLALRAKIRRTALACGLTYAAIAAYIPFLQIAPGASRAGIFGVVLVFGAATFIATVYAACVTHLLNLLIAALRNRPPESATES